MASVEFRAAGDENALALNTKPAAAGHTKEPLLLGATQESFLQQQQQQPARWFDWIYVAYRALQEASQSGWVFYPLILIGLVLLMWQIRSCWRMEVVVTKGRKKE